MRDGSRPPRNEFVEGSFLVRSSRALTEKRLLNIITMLDHHGRHIKRNLEFSHIATSNHYLSDVVGYAVARHHAAGIECG